MHRYLALGDSYTIGEGAPLEANWPSLLTKHLISKKVEVELVGNPSVTGWTTKDLIDHELQDVNSLRPDFISLLIGVNDWVQGISTTVFCNNFNYIVDYLSFYLNEPKKILLVTIPDFGISPHGHKYAFNRDISNGLNEMNEIIKQVSIERSLPCVDIYPISKRMKIEPELVAIDQIHGSALMYKVWEQIIFPFAYNLLRK